MFYYNFLEHHQMYHHRSCEILCYRAVFARIFVYERETTKFFLTKDKQNHNLVTHNLSVICTEYECVMLASNIFIYFSTRCRLLWSSAKLQMFTRRLWYTYQHPDGSTFICISKERLFPGKLYNTVELPDCFC